MIAGFLLAAAAQPAAAAPSPEFVAGRTRIGGWMAEAVTLVNEEASPPLIDGHRCTIDGRGVHLVIGSSTGRFEIGGAGTPFAAPDIAAIEVGGRVYEARMLRFTVPRARYGDVDYPPGHADPDAGEPIEAQLGVRLRPGDPWLDAGSLLVEMFEVRSIGIRYRAAGRETRTRLSVTGLGEAISWCERVFESDRGRRLPGHLIRR